MPTKPQILKRSTLCRSRSFHVESVELRFANGVERTYECLRAGPQPPVLVIPMVSPDEVLLIREYGVGVEGYQLALPKGRAEPGEDALQAAQRELKEETGYGAHKLKLLKCMTQNPNYQQHRTDIVLAEDLFEERLQGDEPEPLEVVPMPLAKIGEWVARDDLTEARTIAALFMARDHFLGGESV